jgi:L-seryl-tRNA(Ser) seleniumtransferase
MIDDVGAGSLIDFSKFGFEPEPTLPDSVKAGADVVTCSADKLIGASQAGIILGKTEYIKAIRKNQFARIVRVDKLTLAVLEATLKLFLDRDEAIKHVPTLQMLAKPEEVISNQAERIVQSLKQKKIRASIAIEQGYSQMGSGSLPTQNLSTQLVIIEPSDIGVEELARRLRNYKTPIFARIRKQKLLIDPRTVRDGEDEIVIEAVAEILSEDKRA